MKASNELAICDRSISQDEVMLKILKKQIKEAEGANPISEKIIRLVTKRDALRDVIKLLKSRRKELIKEIAKERYEKQRSAVSEE